MSSTVCRRRRLRTLGCRDPGRFCVQSQGQPLPDPCTPTQQADGTRTPAGRALEQAGIQSGPDSAAASGELSGRSQASGVDPQGVAVERESGVRAAPRVVVRRRGRGHLGAVQSSVLPERHPTTKVPALADGRLGVSAPARRAGASGSVLRPDGPHDWARRLADLWDESEDVYVYFNNDHRGCAVRNAHRFALAIEHAGLHATRVPTSREASLTMEHADP